jgi:hypothetical protein
MPAFVPMPDDDPHPFAMGPKPTLTTEQQTFLNLLYSPAATSIIELCAIEVDMGSGLLGLRTQAEGSPEMHAAGEQKNPDMYKFITYAAGMVRALKFTKMMIGLRGCAPGHEERRA